MWFLKWHIEVPLLFKHLKWGEMAILPQFKPWKLIVEESGSRFRGPQQEEDGNL